MMDPAGNTGDMSHLYEVYNRQIELTEGQWRDESRYQAVKNAGIGNLFIKCLDSKVTEKELTDIFSPFGTIIRLKVARDDEGKSKGYGFVNYETNEAANSAIKAMNGKILYNKVLFVTHFVRYNDRKLEKTAKKGNTPSPWGK